MKYYIDVNYPGITYTVKEELAGQFETYMVDEGAALQEVPNPQQYDDLSVVKGVYQTPERYGLDLQKGIYYGEAICHEGFQYLYGEYADTIDPVYKTEDDKICRFVNGVFVECVDCDELKQVKRPAVTIYTTKGEDDECIDFDDLFKEEKLAEEEAKLFDMQDSMANIKTRY